MVLEQRNKLMMERVDEIMFDIISMLKKTGYNPANVKFVPVSAHY